MEMSSDLNTAYEDANNIGFSESDSLKSSWCKYPAKTKSRRNKLHSSYVDLDGADLYMQNEHYHIVDRIYFVAPKHDTLEFRRDFVYLNLEDLLPSAPQSGPISLRAIFEISHILDTQLNLDTHTMVAAVAGLSSQSRLNAVFLLGAYVLLKNDIDVSTLSWSLEPIMRDMVASEFPRSEIFELGLVDMWAGLYKAKQFGWVDFSPGEFNSDQYAANDDPFHADLHEIVPGKLVAMRSPCEISEGLLWKDVMQDGGSFSQRDFSTTHLVDALQKLNVQAVIRLSTPEYDKVELINAGIAVADLCISDCPLPSAATIAKFLAIVEAISGAVAVHCKAGLERSGTLIALYLMKNYGFTAREAMGWIRIVRPGSIIGPQQHFLCVNEALFLRSAAKARDSAAAGGGGRRLPCDADVGTVARFIACTVASVDRHVDEFCRRRRAEEGPVSVCGRVRPSAAMRAELG